MHFPSRLFQNPHHGIKAHQLYHSPVQSCPTFRHWTNQHPSKHFCLPASNTQFSRIRFPQNETNFHGLSESAQYHRQSISHSLEMQLYIFHRIIKSHASLWTGDPHPRIPMGPLARRVGFTDFQKFLSEPWCLIKPSSTCEHWQSERMSLVLSLIIVTTQMHAPYRLANQARDNMLTQQPISNWSWRPIRSSYHSWSIFFSFDTINSFVNTLLNLFIYPVVVLFIFQDLEKMSYMTDICRNTIIFNLDYTTDLNLVMLINLLFKNQPDVSE